jgi:hypothetical protein
MLGDQIPPLSIASSGDRHRTALTIAMSAILEPNVDEIEEGVYITEDEETAESWWSSQWERSLAETAF